MASVKPQKVAGLQQSYNEGDFIDAKDNQGDWRVAFIVAKITQAKTFKVRFDGWALKYDETLKFNSPKLKPFRTVVVGYTGQKQNAGVREGWKYDLQHHEAKLAKMRQFMSSPLQLSVHDLNQLVRGWNYLYTDFLMTHKYQNGEEMDSAVRYFTMNLEFLCGYLQRINGNLSEFLRLIEQQHEMESWTAEEAFFKSYYQIFDTVYTITGNYLRLEGFFRSNAELIRGHWRALAHKDPKKVYQIEITKYFIELKGIDLINSLISQLSEIQQIIPFLFLYSLANLILGITKLISTVDREGFVAKLMKVGDSNIKKLREQDFKQFHKDEVSNFLETIVEMAGNTVYESKIGEWSIELQLQICVKMIGCPYFQKKLKGISHILQVCEKHEQLLRSGAMRVWIERTKLLQILFLNNDNQEFIKKACEIVKFFNIRHNILDTHIDLIWQSRLGKHQTIVKEIYNLIAEFPLFEKDVEENVRLFKKVSDLPREQWDEDYIHMLRQFSEHSYGQNIKEKLTEHFGYEIIYEYVLMAESDFAINEFIHLLHRFEKSDVFMQLQENCFKCIEAKNKEVTHIKILQYLCEERLESFDKIQVDMIGILINYLQSKADSENSKQISDGLGLLEEVVRNARKQIQIESLLALWKTYYHSSNREIFLRWLYKRKQSGRVTLNICLTEEHRKKMLLVLWAETEELRAIDEVEVYLFIELFKFVNILKEKMKRVSIVIRPTSLQLDGYDKLWLMLRWSSNEKVANVLCDLLAQIHTCYEGEYLQISIQELVQNISRGITDCVATKNIGYMTRLLLLVKKVLLRDEEIFPFQHSPRVNYIREYTVSCKEKKEEKVLRFNCMSTFYEFKKLLSEKFDIHLHHMVVTNSKNEVIRLENYFRTMNETPFIGGKFEVVEDAQRQSQVKICLNKKLDLFFELLDDSRIEKLVWSIVEKLPISEQLKFKIVETGDILSELQHVGFYKQLYMLKVMNELEEGWWERFTSSANLERLIANYKKILFKTHIELEYVVTLTRIINRMLEVGEKEEGFVIPNRLFRDSLELMRNLSLSVAREGSKSLDLEIKIVKHLFIIGRSIAHVQNLIETFLKSDFVEQLLTLALIQIPNHQIRKAFSDQLKMLLKDTSEENQLQLISLILTALLPLTIALKSKQNLREFYLLASFILNKISGKTLLHFMANQGRGLALQLFELIQKQKPEPSSETTNTSLIGYISLLKHLAVFQPEQTQLQIAQFVIQSCLFTDGVSLSKSKSSRMESFNLLKKLFRNPKVLSFTIVFLKQLHRGGDWRTGRLDDWTITALDKMKSPTGYVGLKNLGCICYMNSFMQQLYMMPYFRAAITSCDDPTFKPELVQENLLYQIQKMFLNLQHSDKKFYVPRQFCHAFKDYDGNPTNVSEQMDIDEFSNILFDRVENQTANTNRATLIQDMFRGVYSNEIVCKGCPHYSETEEHFLSISLTVKSKKNIYQSFDTMIKGDTLDGENAYFCERCNKKVSAVKRVSLKQLPNYLIVTLKRFEFDYEKMIKLKVNDYCEFPINLNLKEYSRQFLRKQESSKIIEEEQVQGNEYFSYILKGVVVHFGYADSGHYYSFVQDRNSSKWFEFNDTNVRDFSLDDLAEEAFGGESSGYDAKEKIKNAYLLVYEREKMIPIGNEVPLKKEEILRRPVNQEIMNCIGRDNKNQKIQAILFSAEYNKFVSSVLDATDEYDATLQPELLKYIVTAFLTVSIREKCEGTILFNLLKRITQEVEKQPDLIEWVVSLFSERRIAHEFFRSNYNRQVKKTLAHWLVRLYPSCNADCQRQFCNLVLNEVVAENQNTLEYSIVLHQISARSAVTLDYLVKHNVVGRLLENVLKKEPKVFVEKLQTLPETDSEIGNEIAIERSSNETKRLKFDNENGYIWALVNNVILRAKQSLLQLTTYLSKAEISYLLLNETKNYKILEQIKNSFQLEEFIRMMGFISTDSRIYLSQALGFVFLGLKEFQSKRYRQFFLLFERLIGVQDKYREARLQHFKKIIEALMHNEQYALDSNIIQQWIIILVNRNEDLRKHLAAETEMLNYLYKLTTKKTPSEDVARKNHIYGDFMVNKLHGVKFPKNKKGYTKLTEEMADFYESIIEDKFEQSGRWPVSAKVANADLKVGDTVAYFDTKEKVDFEEAKVESIFLGRVQLSFKDERTVYVWKDDEKLSLAEMCEHVAEQNDLNSSRTTEMDIDDDDDMFETS